MRGPVAIGRWRGAAGRRGVGGSRASSGRRVKRVSHHGACACGARALTRRRPPPRWSAWSRPPPRQLRAGSHHRSTPARRAALSRRGHARARGAAGGRGRGRGVPRGRGRPQRAGSAPPPLRGPARTATPVAPARAERGARGAGRGARGAGAALGGLLLSRRALPCAPARAGAWDRGGGGVYSRDK